MREEQGFGEAETSAAVCSLDTAAVEADVLARLAAFRSRLGGDLGADFDALAARLRLFDGGPDQGYFSHPLALPVLTLPLWAVAQGAPGSPTLAVSLAEAAAAGYLHVRIEDDWCDEGIGEPGAAMLLSGALFAHHQALLARELPQGSAFWQLFEEVWLGYGEAMSLERRLHCGGLPYDAEAFQRVLARSRPLVLPAAAALFIKGRLENLATLEIFVAALATAHQLFVDLLDAEKDRGLGNTTHVLWRLGIQAGAAGSGAAALRAALYARGGFDSVIEEANRQLARAEAAAAQLGFPEVTRFLEMRARTMLRIQQQAFRAFFTSLAERPVIKNKNTVE